MKTLRVFYVIHQRKQGTNNYAKIKTHKDFPAGNAHEAYDSLYKEHGRFYMDDRTLRAPDEWVEINSHTFVDLDREKPRMEFEKVFEQPLFDPITLKNCLSRDPSKRRK